MKSIANLKNLKYLTIVIFMTATLIAAIPAIIFTDVYAQRDLRSGDNRSGDTHSSALTGDTRSAIVSPEPSTEERLWLCTSKVLKDSSEGNELGWTPDGQDTIFTINEPCYLESDSLVLVNLKDGATNFEACNIDYSEDEDETSYFEVYCSSPPAEGSDLRYMVLVDDEQLEVVGAEPIPMKELPQALVERQSAENATRQ